MKKVLSVMTILLLAITLIACKKDDPALKLLDNASDALEMVITDPNAITTSFTVPTVLAEGVKATWKSSEAGIVSVGEESNGTVNIIVNRPLKGSGNATVTLTAELTIKAENSDEILKKEWKKVLTILESSLEVDIKNIADILALKDDKYDPSEDKDKISVTIKDATVFAVGSDAAFIYDGTGIIQVYGNKDLEVGKVYTIDGLLEWYFGIWEIVKSTATLQATATPQNPTKQTITSVQTQIEALKTAKEHLAAGKSAKDGNFEPIFATITGKVHVIPGDSSNYNTYLVDTETDVTNWKPGTLDNPADGLLFYYNTNDFAYVRTFDTFEVTMDVVIYTYRSNNNAFAVYYVGGKDGIQLGELTDEQVVKLDLASLTQPIEVLEAKEKALTLPVEGENGSEISWEQTKGAEGLVDISNGNVTMPATGQEEITLKATIKKGDSEDSKEFKIWIGGVQTLTVLEAKKLGKDRTFTVVGTLVANSGNRQLTIQDSTGAIVIYDKNLDELKDEAGNLLYAYGDTLTVTGKKDLYNGLHQIAKYEITKKEAGELPAPTVLDEIDLEKLENHQSKRVTLNNMLITAISTADMGSKAITMTLTRADGQTIAVRIDHRVLYEGKNALAELKVDDVINVVGAPLAWFNGPQLAGDRAGQYVKVTTVEDDVKAAFDLLGVNDEFLFNAVGDLGLPIKGTSFESTISYAFKNVDDVNNALIDLATMKVLSVPVEGAVIRLIVTVKAGEVELTKEIVAKVGQITTVAAKYPGGSTTNMTAGNNAATIGLDAELFTVTSTERVNGPLHVGLNTTGQIRLYGSSDTNGNILEFKIADTHRIREVKITFGGTVAPALIKAGETELHNGALVKDSVVTFENLNDSVFSIKNINTSTGQIYVLAVTITYSPAPAAK